MRKLRAENGKTFDCHDYMSEATVEILLGKYFKLWFLLQFLLSAIIVIIAISFSLEMQTLCLTMNHYIAKMYVNYFLYYVALHI